ncbi:MAG: hypothetical protein ACD_20C00243G0003 [uncultured bacterium]|nr:MAG: hypothetical protein ACD_20C00243G0003 [uncultured bacterium]
MKHDNNLKLMDKEVEEIEESNKDLYIENYSASLNEHLEKIQMHVKSAMYDAIFIDKLIKSKIKSNNKVR